MISYWDSNPNQQENLSFSLLEPFRLKTVNSKTAKNDSYVKHYISLRLFSLKTLLFYLSYKTFLNYDMKNERSVRGKCSNYCSSKSFKTV